MENLFEFQNWVKKTPDWIEGGYVFVKGESLENGKSNLFLFKLKSLQNLTRNKKNNEMGIPVFMALLFPEVSLVGYTLEKKLITRKVMPTVPYLQRFVGINEFKVGLNQNKTPNWKKTINEKNLRKVLDDAEYWILAEPWAEIPIFNP